MRGLGGKLVVVTGGGGGIGAATAARFAEEGARVLVADINESAAQAAVDRIASAGGTAMPMIVDLTDYAAVKAAVAEAETAHGPIDILVNNAGWDLFVPFLKPVRGHVRCVIAEGDPQVLIDGVPVAFEGHKTSCGAVLISTLPEVGRG